MGLREGDRRRYESYIESRVLELGMEAGRKELAGQWRSGAVAGMWVGRSLGTNCGNEWGA